MSDDDVGTLVHYLRENYSEEDIVLLENLLTGAHFGEMYKFIMEGLVNMDDLALFSTPYTDLPLIMFSSENKDELSRTIIRWRLKIGR